MFTFLIDKICIALRGRPKLQSSHYQNKHLTRTLFEKHSLLLWSIMPNFCCAFGCSNKRKTGSKSHVSYYRVPFDTDPESLSLRKRWIAAIRKENLTENQIDNSKICSNLSSLVSQRKLWWLVEVWFSCSFL